MILILVLYELGKPVIMTKNSLRIIILVNQRYITLALLENLNLSLVCIQIKAPHPHSLICQLRTN